MHVAQNHTLLFQDKYSEVALCKLVPTKSTRKKTYIHCILQPHAYTLNDTIMVQHAYEPPQIINGTNDLPRSTKWWGQNVPLTIIESTHFMLKKQHIPLFGRIYPSSKPFKMAENGQMRRPRLRWEYQASSASPIHHWTAHRSSPGEVKPSLRTKD